MWIIIPEPPIGYRLQILITYKQNIMLNEIYDSVLDDTVDSVDFNISVIIIVVPVDVNDSVDIIFLKIVTI